MIGVVAFLLVVTVPLVVLNHRAHHPRLRP